LNLIDTHAHLDAKDFDSDREEMISRAVKAGVKRIITIGAGYGIESASRAVALAEKHDFIWATVGIHPQDAMHHERIGDVATLATHERVVAIGETGLDFFRDYAPHDIQEKCFRDQVEIARSVAKPLVIHSRSAGEECLSILKDSNAKDVGGVFHCFEGNAEYAKRLLDINFKVSFPGIVTFKNAKNVHETVRHVPLEQMFLETDAPYLAPVPYRGKRCESAYIIETARAIAELKGLDVSEVVETTTRNAVEFFKL